MEKKDNQSKQNRIYIKSAKAWFDVPEDQYQAYDRRVCAIRKRMQYHGECICTKRNFWLCDGMCQDCVFYRPAAVSLNTPLPDGDGTLEDYVPGNAPTPEEIVSDKLLLESLIDHLREIDPDADQIIQIWKDNPDGISDRKVAQMLGRAQRTFAYEMKKFRADCRKIRRDKD
jgi:hypothetical protein